MDMRLRVLCYAALIIVWGAFAWVGKTSVDAFIQAIGAALAVLGTVHVATSPAAPDKKE